MGEPSSRGLTCPSCAGIVPVEEGVRVVKCPYCHEHSILQGDAGVRRWQVRHQVSRASALRAIKDFFAGVKKARDLGRTAEVQELFPIYVPYWRVRASVAGWVLGRRKVKSDEYEPREIEIMEEMQWTDASAEVSELGVHSVRIPPGELEPYDPDALRRKAMVFDPTESPEEAMAEAARHFAHRARRKERRVEVVLEKVYLLRQRLALVYYPLWVARYTYRDRAYQAVVDGVGGGVLYGKAPGNIGYRAAVLVAAMAIGNFVLVHGTALAARLIAAMDDPDDGAAMLLLIPLSIGVGFVAAGYQSFRYGEEVEVIHEVARKAAVADAEETALDRLPGGRIGTKVLERMR